MKLKQKKKKEKEKEKEKEKKPSARTSAKANVTGHRRTSAVFLFTADP